MADIVIVGAGPVGLWTAIQIKKRQPDADIQIYERYQTYQRSHVLRLEHFSMLLYGRNSNDPLEKQFYNDVTGKSLVGTFVAAARAGAVYIRTNDLEKALKSYAKALGINIDFKKIEDPQAIMGEHPECRSFIAADGAHSLMRTALLGEDAIKHYHLQHVAEVKYQAEDSSGPLKLRHQYKTNKISRFPVFEYVGKEKDNIRPVTLRVFLDKGTYNALPEATFKAPLSLYDPDLPEPLVESISTYMNVRQTKTGENYIPDSGKLSKLRLSVYASKRFALRKADKSWFFVGDAAMGVPYFRSLNSGLIVGSQLAWVLTRKSLSDRGKTMAYNFCRPFDIAWEFTYARLKNLGLKAYDEFRKASARVPWETVKWGKQDARDFQALNHIAFRPGDNINIKP